MVHLKHKPLESIHFDTDRERWEEMEARQLETNADYLRDECIPGWLEKLKDGWHPDTAKMIYEICVKMQTYEAMADQLRRPRYIREERKQYEVEG